MLDAITTLASSEYTQRCHLIHTLVNNNWASRLHVTNNHKTYQNSISILSDWQMSFLQFVETLTSITRYTIRTDNKTQFSTLSSTFKDQIQRFSKTQKCALKAGKLPPRGMRQRENLKFGAAQKKCQIKYFSLLQTCCASL